MGESSLWEKKQQCEKNGQKVYYGLNIYGPWDDERILCHAKKNGFYLISNNLIKNGKLGIEMFFRNIIWGAA